MAIFLHRGPRAPGVDYSTPYPVVTVELEEQPGLRFTSTVVGADNNDIRIGAAVRLDWSERSGAPMPVFVLERRTGMTMKDRVAIAGASTTGFVAKNLAAQSGIAGRRSVYRRHPISAASIARRSTGSVGSWPSAATLQSVLGIPKVTWFGNPVIPLVDHVATAAAAVHAGLCEVVLVYHAAYRAAWNTGSALKDPFRRIATPGLSDPHPGPETMAAAVGYTGWASRYMYEYGVTREDFGLVAINSRSHAVGNPAAAMREPMTMDDYLTAPDDPGAAVPATTWTSPSTALTRSSSRPPSGPGTWRCRPC